MLIARGVSVDFGSIRAVAGADLELRKGEWVALIGPNGAGKSSLLRVVAGLTKPSAGEVRIEGESIAGMKRVEVAKQIAFVPQGVESTIPYSVRYVVESGRNPYLGTFKLPTSVDRLAVERALEATDLTRLADRPLSALSAGERQRALVARAFAQQTPVLLMDEPSSNLDIHHERAMLDAVDRRRRSGVAVISILHDLATAAEYADRLVVMSAGSVVAVGAPNETLTGELLRRIFRVTGKVLWTVGKSRPLIELE